MAHKHLTKDGNLKYASIKALLTTINELHIKITQIAAECGMPVDNQLKTLKVKRIYSPSDIVYKVSRKFKVNPKLKSRKPAITEAKFAAIYLLRKYTNLSLKDVAIATGGNDHTTAMNGYKKALEWMATNEDFKSYVTELSLLIEAEIE